MPPPEDSQARDRHLLVAAELTSRLEERVPLIDEILARLAERGHEPHPLHDRLILDELITNAIVHGNRGEPDKLVKVRVHEIPDGWSVEIEDEGEGFDWRAQLERSRNPMPSVSSSGRGLALILALGAELHYLGRGHHAVMVRRVGSQVSPGDRSEG